MKALVRIPLSGGDPGQKGKVHIAREGELAPCCGLHRAVAGHWQVDTQATPDCETCKRIWARFIATYTPPLVFSDP